MKTQKLVNTSKLMIATALIIVGTSALTLAGQGNRGNPGVFPPQSSAYGKSYAEWSAAWWQWAMELPIVDSAGHTHPFIDSPTFDVTEGQSGQVWFLAGSFGAPRSCAIPAGKALFIAVLNAECSTLEDPPFHGVTEAEQRACATASADGLTDLFCSIDGVAVANISAYRFVSPQFSFTAPTPWIFAATGGSGTSVSDGYFIFLPPLSVGQHTIRFGGAFAPGTPVVEQVYNLTIGN